MVVVAVVGAVVCQVVLQAGPRGGGVTAAERNAIQQVTVVHVTPDTTGMRKTKERKARISSQFLLPFSAIRGTFSCCRGNPVLFPCF